MVKAMTDCKNCSVVGEVVQPRDEQNKKLAAAEGLATALEIVLNYCDFSFKRSIEYKARKALEDWKHL